MGKRSEFRAGKKKRGFDDDFEAPHTRNRRGGEGMRQPRGFDAPPPGFAAPPMGPTLEAAVKWFNSEKGFGFIELSDGSGDAFLHIGVLQAAGRESVPPGAKLRVEVGQGAKGRQVTRVLEVDESTATAEPARRGPPRPRPGGGRMQHDPATAAPLDGAVKWFNSEKGFGFIGADDGGKDVFVHISVLERSGVTSLAEGQRVAMRVVETPKGREAVSISLAG
ncbi:MAG: cold shock domain-containing protein [Alphaproteobacteria bacterium]|nr:cold shock domain-containing protein [Alphaproteobacteria bacterium]